MSRRFTEDFWLNHAIEVIKDTYGDTVSLQAKNKDLLKFGRSTAVTGTKTTLEISPNANETFLTTNAITHISSSNNSDTVPVKIEGHTVDGNGDFTFSVQEVTLAGQTKTALSTPLARVTRLYNNSIGTPPANGTELLGNVYVYEDDTVTAGVPNTNAKVHMQVQAGHQNSEKAATTISKNDYWIVTGVYADVLEKISESAEIIFEMRTKGGVFRESFTMSAAKESAGTFRHAFPYIIVPPNTDVRLRGRSDGTSIEVSGGIFGPLLLIV